VNHKLIHLLSASPVVTISNQFIEDLKNLYELQTVVPIKPINKSNTAFAKMPC
jgi:hypothetical protein